MMIVTIEPTDEMIINNNLQIFIVIVTRNQEDFVKKKDLSGKRIKWNIRKKEKRRTVTTLRLKSDVFVGLKEKREVLED